MGSSSSSCWRSKVHVIDSSAPALAQLENNAKLNNVSDKIKIIHDDAFKALANLKHAKEQFDVIILDPPAFIKREKRFKRRTTHINALMI